MALNLVSGITEQLGSIIASEFTLTASVKEEIPKLERKFRTIQAVLDDAEKRQVKEKAVKLWLDKLKDVSYEMDDVLDEWNTAMIKAAIAKEEEEEEEAETSTAKKRKVWPLIPNINFSILHHRDIAHKIKELNEKLDEIIKEREMYGFELTGAIEVVERPKTTSFLDVSEICGRDNVKGDLVSILLGRGSEEEGSPHVISLVGMGGIGKTTLAQLAYNDPEVKSHFEKRIWVCVSEPFDQCRVAKAILEAFGGGHPNSTELQSLLEKICELIERKKFLLVLDDVWTEDATLWKPFKVALKNGAQGSRILVTTRKIRVVEIMGSTSARMINLEVLSEKDCWLVFSKIAFSGKDAEKCEELEVLGRQIAKKCKGLPLAAKTIGSLMRFQENDELVEMWMAQGYINSKEDMEIIAREYFENLAIRSFFQDFKKDEDDGKLINLRHLILDVGVFPLEYPSGFGRLTSLRRLSHFYVSGTKDGCKLGELKDLNQLQGSLDIRGLGNVVDACEAENAQLKKKIHLHTLKLQFTGGAPQLSPNWTMSLTKLKTLCLHCFKNLEHLPPLGKLPVLESLKITMFNSLRKVGVEFLGIESENKKEDNMQIFPNLKSLEFNLLNQWEEWIGIGGKREEEEDSNITIMPRLQHLVILHCRYLNSLPDFLRTIPLKKLEIDPTHTTRWQRGTGEEWRMISHIPNIKIDGKYVQRDGQEVKSEANVVADALSGKSIGNQLANLRVQPTLVERIKVAQAGDPQLQKMKLMVESGTQFEFCIHEDGSLRFGNRLCVPNDPDLKEEILSEAHNTGYTVHPGGTKMYRDLKGTFWWNNMKREIAGYVARCLVCQQVKIEHQRPGGLLQSLPIPEWKWEHISMDFVTGFPRTPSGNDSIWVIVDRLTKSAHFLAIKVGLSLERLAKLYVDEIVRLHGVPVTIVSDRDRRFVSQFWKKLHMAMGTNLNFSTAFHPQTDGQSERTIQILEDMLRACAIDFKGSWEGHLPLVEFAYNNSYQASIQMAPYEALYGRKCRSPICWDDIGERKILGPEIVQHTVDKIQLIRERLRSAQSRQKSYADTRRRKLEYLVGDHVFLRVSPTKGVMRFGVHNVFHVSMLRKYVPDRNHVVAYEPLQLREDLTYEEQPVRIVDRKEKELRRCIIQYVKVQWRNHSEREATWELEEEIREKYPYLFKESCTSSLED
uniref:Integrase catalytic domain-containing protein n=2 Tax=Fagus sylvatica TaxID=28930 RepID=A0A2N9GSB9_FAGSY